MGKSDTFHNASRSFLLWWILANVLGLPFLVEGYNSVENIIWAIFGIFYDRNVGLLGHLYIVVLLLLSGFILGGCLGLIQWFVLRKKFPQAARWILATSIGVAIGTLLFWLQYILLFAITPINERQSAIFFSSWYSFIAYGICLGLSIGVSQWLVLKQWVHKAIWWAVVFPLCATLGFYFANLYLIYIEFQDSIYMLRQQMAMQFPEISNMQMLVFFIALCALTALIGIGLVTGVLLDRLLRFHNKQKALQQKAATD
ncbi:MAG: hypothetical protein L6461_12360 [Anaerolineae bacterium]|nr:hypothetical protein [Anaerolineae bacterium]